MSKVLFLNIPHHGHINPTLGLVEELSRRGEVVVYFSTEEFREKIEKAGGIFKELNKGIWDLKPIGYSSDSEEIVQFFNKALESIEPIIKYILEQIGDIKFDYMVYGSSLYYGSILAQILKIPSVSSFAIMAEPEALLKGYSKTNNNKVSECLIFDKILARIKQLNDINIPSLKEMFFSKGDLNIFYTSPYFVPQSKFYENNSVFIRPPFDIKQDVPAFPFVKLVGHKVIYISLGTVYNSFDAVLPDIFFKAFADTDAVIVMTSYNQDISSLNVPDNFIVRNFVPQSEVLKYADAAVIHAGMNTTNDMFYNNVPFVCIPLGLDQYFMAQRSVELGAAIYLDKNALTPEILRKSTFKVMTDNSYRTNISKIRESFFKCEGYSGAVDEILKVII